MITEICGLNLENKKIYCTSDSHFGHAKILETERGQKFSSIENHDKIILEYWEKWLETVSKNNGVFVFLGDFGKLSFNNLLSLKQIFAACDCPKLAIKGNHDKDDMLDTVKTLFDYVSPVPIYVNKRVVLSHEPMNVWESQLNVHGHLHNSYLNGKNWICASIHVANYQLITQQQISNRLSQIKKWNNRFLYEPWADKYVYKKDNPDVIKDKDGNIDLSASRMLKYMREKNG